MTIKINSVVFVVRFSQNYFSLSIIYAHLLHTYKHISDPFLPIMADSWNQKISKLLEEESRFTTLSELKEQLEALSDTEVNRTARQLQLPLIFDCLNGSDQEQVELACDVLSLCMSHLSLGESTNRYDVFLERALNHPFTPVKLMALTEIERSTASEQHVTALSKRMSLLTAIIKNIAHDELSVAHKASVIVEKIGATSHGIQQLMVPDVMKTIFDVSDTNEVVRLRVFEVVVNIAKISEQKLNLLESTGYLNLMLKELDNNDVLLRMNIIEILTRLVVKKHGFVFLQRQKFMDKLFQLDEIDALSLQLCEPIILKFFGSMVSVEPTEILSKYQKMWRRIITNLESDDLVLFGVSIDTFGYISATNEGKLALDALSGNEFSHGLRIITRRLPTLPTELKVRALKALENVLRADDHASNITSLTLKWFQAMGDDVMEKFLSYAKNPFGEIRFAGLSLLLAMASQQWAQSIIKDVPGLVEFFMDRSVETVKECKEIKYEIVKKLSESTEFDSFTLKRLKTFVKEGPFYVLAVTEVAIEGND